MKFRKVQAGKQAQPMYEIREIIFLLNSQHLAQDIFMMRFGDAPYRQGVSGPRINGLITYDYLQTQMSFTSSKVPTVGLIWLFIGDSFSPQVQSIP